MRLKLLDLTGTNISQDAMDAVEQSLPGVRFFP
jgi:hypothetical protein